MAFEPASERNVVVIVCDVGQLTICCKVAESYYTTNSDKEADKESMQNSDFASSVPDLEVHNLRDREEEDHEVEEDVESAIGVHCNLSARTRALVFPIPLVPEIAERSTISNVVDPKA
jgi:hypothetical protein